MELTKTVFLSYAGGDAFEASLLQYALETSPSGLEVKVNVRLITLKQ